MLAKMVVSRLRSITNSGLVVCLHSELVYHVLLETFHFVLCLSVIGLCHLGGYKL